MGGNKFRLHNVFQYQLLLAVVGTLIFSTAQADTPVLLGRSVTKSEDIQLQRFEKISHGPANGISRLFWEEQYDIQDKLFESLGGLELGLEFEKDLGSNYRLLLSGDISPERKVFRMNVGEVVDGTPDENAESYYLVLDQLKTKLFGAFDYVNDGDDSEVYYSPLAIEGSETLRKLTPVREYADYRDKILERDSKLDAFVQQVKFDETRKKGRLKKGVTKGLRWTYRAIAEVYEKLGDLFHAGSQVMADEEASKIFFVVPYDGVRLKERMFTIDAHKFLENVSYDETLNFVRTFHLKFSRVGGAVNGLGLAITPRSIVIQTERTATRLPQSECETEVEICKRIHLSLKYIVGKGHQLDIDYKPGVGPFNLRIFKGSRNKTTYYEVEHIYLLDLDKQDAQDTFNTLFADFNPSLEDWREVPVIKQSGSVKLHRVYWRGKGAQVNKSGRLELGLYKRRLINAYDEYPLCFADVTDEGVQEKICNYSARSEKASELYNRVKWVRDSESNYVGLVGITNPGLEDDASFRTTDGGSNLHFAIHYNDRFAEDYNSLFEKLFQKILPRAASFGRVKRQDYYDRLENIRVALAIEQMPELYNQPDFFEIASRLNELKNKYRDIEHTLQNINLDIYMNHNFTREILSRSEDEVLEALKAFGLNKRRQKKLLQAFLDAKRLTSDGQIKTLVHLYDKMKKRPHFAGLMLMLGRNHVQRALDGDLAIRFMSEASDLHDNEKFKEIVVGANLEEFQKKVFEPREEFGEPEPGMSRLSNIYVSVLDNKVYLNFLSTLKETPNRKPLALVGHVAKFKLFKADEKKVDLYVPTAIPYEKGDGLYRYVIELGSLENAGLVAGEDYTLQFRLIDPSLDEEIPSRRLSETRETAFRF